MHQKQVVIRDLKVEVVTHSRFFDELSVSASAWVVTILAGTLYTNIGLNVGIQVKTVQVEAGAVQIVIPQTVDGLTELIGIMLDGGEVVIVAPGAEVMFLALTEDSF